MDQKEFGNKPEDILSAWIALEVLSPLTYRCPEDLANGIPERVAEVNLQDLAKDDSERVTGHEKLPWEKNESLRKGYRLYYQIILGSICMEKAVKRLTSKYSDTRPEEPSVRGEAALAIVVVDDEGQLAGPSAVVISSFGWGLMTALEGNLEELANWPAVEPELVKRVKDTLLGMATKDKNQEKPGTLSLTGKALLAAYEVLVRELKLPEYLVEPPKFAIRSYVNQKDPNPPEPLLCNSFFLEDLVFARSLFSFGKAPKNLLRYLGVEQPQQRKDLLNDKDALEEAVSPGWTPLARWPGPERHPLVLLQQAAVNCAFHATRIGGLLSVNGPPGTGKTTLLRDIVAGIVTARAEAMMQFDNPEDAFKCSGQKLLVGGSWIDLYRLNQSLRGFEMVVASSNNKAVENVSAELPSLGAIAKDALNLRYFKKLSDKLYQPETWGMIAAVLGNTQNRSQFKETFWWDEDEGLRIYLQAAVRSVQEVETTDPQTGQVKKQRPAIVASENPPRSHAEALSRWNKAREQFREAVKKSHCWHTWLESVRADLLTLPKLAQAEAAAQARRDDAEKAVQTLEEDLATARGKEYESLRRLRYAEQELEAHRLKKPGLWARLFRTRIAREWSNQLAALRAAHHRAESRHRETEAERRRVENELQWARLQQQNAEKDLEDARIRHQRVQQRLTEAEHREVILADDDFFKDAHDARHKKTPWFPREAQRLRDEVFIAAMAVHRAFIDAAARPLRHNLGALMDVFMTQTLLGAEKQKLLPDLWASLFLVVPLVSTTFASFNRMLGKLPLESLGWLIVDEAGQSLPQAAVGALLRTRRAVIVGDPMQIEPVVVLPDTLTNTICHRFDVDPDRYAPPRASVQTLADAASEYTGTFEGKYGSRQVGVPLLVHRRCSNPMFTIANKIAYANQMVFAKSPSPSSIKNVLGDSKWIHVEGSGEDKWCPAEGDEVLRLLEELAQAEASHDLYIITPFVIVAEKLRQMIRKSKVLEGWINDNWINKRVGTVHTAQGREAGAVILVLGAPLQDQKGARDWAGNRPNLLNVAVTRAKEVIYVVGNWELWCEAGCFKELDSALPKLCRLYGASALETVTTSVVSNTA
ncbi:MAG: AAA domain-containing protein [Chloracidobacterium sp.]|nr:AAA domain-containing protein [Chloracidobacterium sp.]MDW8216734.1 AAA domain-containing protein [Acidobacteriota bacterium]